MWVPEACTLPTVEQPLRVAEFDALFATGVRGVERLSPTRLRWRLDPGIESRARDLAARETSCCGFFSFDFRSAGEGELELDVTVGASQVEVLDALENRSAAATPPAS